MENDKNNNGDGGKFLASTSCFPPPPPFTCHDGQEISPPTPIVRFLDSAGPSGTKVETFTGVKYQQKPRKKRTKLVKIDENWVVKSKPKCARKPDPNAPKITRPCTECGKKFWSWKALFGHMRCHPERQWRGINPPPNFIISSRHHNEASTSGCKKNSHLMSQEDHEVARCLLMLAANNVTSQGTLESHNVVGLMGWKDNENAAAGSTTSSLLNCSRFECSICRKMFGSHLALGVHRASHKKVKGCFAITKNDGQVVDRMGEGEVKDAALNEDKMLMVYGHKCSICLRVFSSGQALGGHKRCHWEKWDDPSGLTQDINPVSSGKEGSSGLDLNLPAFVEDDDSSASYSSSLALDLRLGI